MITRERSEAYNQALEVFIHNWGKMSSEWGINKTMAQIYALLFASYEPMDTDTIMFELNISRGNANMNLRNLIQWGLIHKVNIKGKRRDYYTSESDIWNMAAKIIDERRQKEIEPIKKTLDTCSEILEKADNKSADVKQFKEKIDAFKAFLTLFSDFAEAVLPYISDKNVEQIKGIVEMAAIHKKQMEMEK
jgi:DNA-binding transcriptional regulator GbsR (MarR family)